MIPDTPPTAPPEPPDYPWDITAITTRVNRTLHECESVVNKYIDQIHDIVVGCVTSCGQTWAQCESCIEGKINERLTRADTVVAKCSSKIMDRAQILFNQAESRVYDVTGKIPEMRDIVAEEMTREMPQSSVGIPPLFPPATPSQQKPVVFGGVSRPTVPQLPPPVIGSPDTPSGGVIPPTISGGCPAGSVGTYDEGVLTGCLPGSPVGGITTPPISCDVAPPDCPAGMQAQLNADGTAWECVPIPIPEPPCPPPAAACPLGQEWDWDGKVWKCKLIKPIIDTKPDLPPSTRPPTFADFIGLTTWNTLDCPDVFLSSDPQSIDTAANVISGLISLQCNRLMQPLLLTTPGPITAVYNQFVGGIFKGVCGAITGIIEAGIKWTGLKKDCDYLTIAPLVPFRALLALIEKWADIGLDDLATTVNYSISRACPTHLPTQPSVDQIYLSNRITREVWECWTRANNNLDKPAFEGVMAARQQPNVLQWITAWMRDLISSETLTSKLRGSGVLDRAEGDVLIRLMEQFPGPSDIIRFMLRDVEDTTIIDRYKLDTEFTDKFKGRSKFWAKAQGLPDDLMLRYWRAHWDWPSNTQLYVMLHRLRADSLDPAIRKIAIDIDDVRNVMSVNDVIPIWRDRLAAISYYVPHLSTAFDFFYYGRWDTDQLLDFYQNYGYSKQVADDHVSLAIKNKRLRQAAKAAFITKRYLKEAYTSGAIGRQEARLGLDMLLMTNEQAEEAMQHLDYLRIVARRKDTMSAIKCRFKACEITKDTAVSLLVSAGWQLEDAIDDVTCWKAQCEIKGKEATAAQLCTWWGMGLLTDNEYRIRLRRLGYSDDDTRRIMTKCAADLEKKQSKEKKGSSKNGQPTA